MLLQLATIFGEDRRSFGANQNGVLHAETPRPRVQPAVAYRDDHIGLKRLWLFLAVEEGMARRQGGLLELDTHAVDRRAEDVLPMPCLFKNPMAWFKALRMPSTGSCSLVSCVFVSGIYSFHEQYTEISVEIPTAAVVVKKHSLYTIDRPCAIG